MLMVCEWGFAVIIIILFCMLNINRLPAINPIGDLLKLNSLPV